LIHQTIDDTALQLQAARWTQPLWVSDKRYLGAKGGRASGKSHFFAERAVDLLLCEPDTRIVCIREIQRSLKFSAKQLIEDKIKEMQIEHLFDIQLTEIRRREGSGLIIFQGMQDHTADSIKSLEGFDVAWCEEAQSLSARSIELLDPTMRKEQAQLWFSWNPRNEDDAVEALFQGNDRATLVHVNYLDNPFCPTAMKELAQSALERDPDRYNHVWLGDYERVSDTQVFHGKWKVDEFVPMKDWSGPYLGVDFGFRPDPLCAVKG